MLARCSISKIGVEPTSRWLWVSEVCQFPSLRQRTRTRARGENRPRVSCLEGKVLGHSDTRASGNGRTRTSTAGSTRRRLSRTVHYQLCDVSRSHQREPLPGLEPGSTRLQGECSALELERHVAVILARPCTLGAHRLRLASRASYTAVGPASRHGPVAVGRERALSAQPEDRTLLHGM